ncbi:MAG: hypothetical protein J5950_07865 [Clostridia bacterium]|nr:hypothetical protein [Clostridia bacterium]
MSYWIRAAERPDQTHFYYFTKNIDLPFDPEAITTLRLNVCADTRYRLYLNGTFAGEGPCQGSEYSRYFETYKGSDIIGLLKPGRNEICVKVLYVQEGSFISLFRGSRPALWIDGEIEYLADGETAKFAVVTDTSWTCERDDNVTFRHFYGIHTSTPPGEEVWGDPRLSPVGVEQFQTPVPRGYNLFGLADAYPLEARPIPQLRYEDAKGFRIVRKTERYTDIDAGVYTTAIPTIEATGAPGSVIKIIYGECYVISGENGARFKGLRDAGYADPSADLGERVYYDVIHIPESGKLSFTPFWYRAFRFIRLEFSDPSVNFTALTYRPCFYPFDETGSFDSSDPALAEMWKVSVNTVKCCAHEIYIDCPYYEQQQYDMDSCLEMLFTQRMISDSRLPLKSVTDLARSQIYNGMLQANYPSVMTQIIPDFTLFWVIMLREFIRYAPDNAETRSQAAAFLGTVDKALESFELFRDATGLVGDNPYWSFVDWVPGWMAGITPGGPEGEPITVASMMFVAALRNAAEVADYCGRSARKAEYIERADKLASLIVEKCFDKETGLFRNTPFRREFSEHTSVWAVLGDIVSGKEAEELMERTMNGCVPVAHCTFSMGFFLFRALEKAGLYDRYAPRLFEGWQKMLDNHCTTWCENPDSPRSECHGWSSAPAYELSAMILGAYPEENGYRTLRIRPHLFVLDTKYASGCVPTPFGTVKIDLSRQASSDAGERRFSIKVTLPDGSVFEKDGCPDGEEFRFAL